MTPSMADRLELQDALSAIWQAAVLAHNPSDLDEARKAVISVRDACLRAGEVIGRIEEQTRQQAFVDLSERIQQQVGMEPESL